MEKIYYSETLIMIKQIKQHIFDPEDGGDIFLWNFVFHQTQWLYVPEDQAHYLQSIHCP
jgi:hypothetical protein